MIDQQFCLTLQPAGRRVWALAGTSVLEAVARAGLVIDTPCGGKGTCGKCRVRIVEGAAEPTSEDRAIFPAGKLDDGWRLACQCRIRRPMIVEIDETCLFAASSRIVTDSACQAWPVDPAVRKTHLRLTAPSLEDDAADLLRLESELGAVRVDLDLLQNLGPTLRKADFDITATVADGQLIAIEPGDTTDRCYGLAVDLGTTTLVASLIDLVAGRQVDMESMINPQVQFGDDVVSRIQHATSSRQAAVRQRQAVVEAINRMVGLLCGRGGVEPDSIYEMALAGNTTMEHLLCGLDVSQLGQLPFSPAFARGLLLKPLSLGLSIRSTGRVYAFPVIGGFVGGDTVACLLAGGMARSGKPELLVDVGTNGEIVLCCDGQIWAASTAAGPAFEGARIAHGMRAGVGAIEKVVCDNGRLEISVIGNGPARGICGSGLIDLLAELLRSGVVGCEGLLRSGQDLPESAGPDLARRVIPGPGGQPMLRLAENPGGEAICLTQRDIREVQLGTGAIRAGISILLDKAGIGPEKLDRVLLAGGFGSFIRRSNAQRIGLLPGQIEHHRIHYVGNASLAGARQVLLSAQARSQADACDDPARRGE
ncbi:MAG: ASKHA domain-containing protein, partial [Planctomycetota bacterium]